MKIPTPIGQFITKNEIIICPDCQGEGIIYNRPDREDMPAWDYCPTCEGKRVLQKVENVLYKRVFKTDNQ
jgi:DnaJ-class molecular chaperone